MDFGNRFDGRARPSSDRLRYEMRELIVVKRLKSFAAKDLTCWGYTLDAIAEISLLKMEFITCL